MIAKEKKKRKAPCENGLTWTKGLPKEIGYYCLNYSIKKYYFDGINWFVPVLKPGRSFLTRGKVDDIKIKCYSKI